VKTLLGKAKTPKHNENVARKGKNGFIKRKRRSQRRKTASAERSRPSQRRKRDYRAKMLLAKAKTTFPSENAIIE